MRTLRILIYFILPLAGLLWAMGCSSPTGSPHENGGNGEDTYTMDVSVAPTTITADSGQGVISCFLYLNGNVLGGQQVWFSTYSEEVSNANITVAGFTSATSPTGLSTNVLFRPNNFAGALDTIFAHFTIGIDTVASAFTTVTIHHPDIALEIYLDDQDVHIDSSSKVNCFLTADGTIVPDKVVTFWTMPEGTSSIVVPSSGLTSSVSPTGLFSNIYYFPGGYEGPADTIYVRYIDEPETLATSYTVVNIIQ